MAAAPRIIVSAGQARREMANQAKEQSDPFGERGVVFLPAPRSSGESQFRREESEYGVLRRALLYWLPLRDPKPLPLREGGSAIECGGALVRRRTAHVSVHAYLAGKKLRNSCAVLVKSPLRYWIVPHKVRRKLREPCEPCEPDITLWPRRKNFQDVIQ
jgi:hypothetical protein